MLCSTNYSVVNVECRVDILEIEFSVRLNLKNKMTAFIEVRNCFHFYFFLSLVSYLVNINLGQENAIWNNCFGINNNSSIIIHL